MLNNGVYLDLYYWLVLTRRAEEKLREVYRSQKDEKLIFGNIYLSTLQEAIAVGAACAVRPTDWISHTHRELGALLVRGRCDLEKIFANYLAKQTGYTRGRDSGLNFGNMENRVILKHPFMAVNLLVAAGVAWEIKNQKRGEIVLAFLGDGATSEGFTHEAMNAAGLWKLPIVFVCNNNQLAISTPFEKQVAGGNIAQRAAAYGFKSARIDGTDVLKVHKAVSMAADLARAGDGPVLIECVGFRISGHAEHDAADYIPKEIWDEWKKPEHDPIVKFQRYLIGNRLANETDLRERERMADEEITSAWEKAKSQPFPAPESSLDDLFKGGE